MKYISMKYLSNTDCMHMVSFPHFLFHILCYICAYSLYWIHTSKQIHTHVHMHGFVFILEGNPSSIRENRRTHKLLLPGMFAVCICMNILCMNQINLTWTWCESMCFKARGNFYRLLFPSVRTFVFQGEATSSDYFSVRFVLPCVI